MLLHQFLFDHLHAHGVRHIFGIPGDFVLNLYNALEDDGRFQLVTLSHEPAVGFAADGAARISNGLGVCGLRELRDESRLSPRSDLLSSLVRLAPRVTQLGARLTRRRRMLAISGTWSHRTLPFV